MKKYILLLVAFFGALLIHAQENSMLGDNLRTDQIAPNINYQAQLSDNGKVLSNRKLQLEISLQDENKTVYFTEVHSTQTSSLGTVNLQIGTGKAIKGLLKDVPWTKGIFIALKADLGNEFKSLGSPVKMQAVPYAFYAKNAPLIRSTTTEPDAPIFQVQGCEGNPLFTVYEGGYVTLNVDDERGRRPRGGFAVHSFQLNSLRDPQQPIEPIDRFTIADGRFDITVAPTTRRPKGGFAVNSFNAMRDGENKTATLLAMNDRATYFTVDAEQKAAFQLRDREKSENIILNITNKGEIQTKKEPSDVFEQLPAVGTLTLTWVGALIEGADSPAPAPVQPEPLKFSNVLRWFYPVVKDDGNEVTYDMKLVDNPTGDKITNYLTVGAMRIDTTEYRVGLTLNDNLKVTTGTKIPGGQLQIWNVERPETPTIVTIPEQTVTITDKLKITDRSVETEITKESFLAPLYFYEITEKATSLLPVLNLNLKCQITSGEFKDCLQVYCQNKWLRFRVVDKEKYKKALNFQGSTVQSEIPLQITFPNDIFPPQDLKVKLTVNN